MPTSETETETAAAASVAARGRYGGYRDPGTGCRVIVTTPQHDPQLWQAYLSGALDSYRRYGVEAALEYESVRSGDTTALFFAVLRGASVVAGVRAAGPYRSAEEAHAVSEWTVGAGRDAVRRSIAARLPEGAVEMKAGWVGPGEHSDHLAGVIARAAVHVLDILHVRYAFGTAALGVIPRWSSTGAVVAGDVPASEYPDTRYRSYLIWWDRHRCADRVAADQLALLHLERSEIRGHLHAG